MKVLHVITGLNAGGAEQQLRSLLRHRRCPAEVVALGNLGVVADGLRADGVTVHAVPMRGNTDLPAVFRLAGLIRRGRFDVVHTHLYRACVYGRVAARIAGVRAVVATEHSLGDEIIEGRPVGRPGVRGLYLASERLGRMTVAVSQDVAERLHGWGVPPGRVRVIRNGLDVSGFRFDPVARSRVRGRLGIGPGATVVGAVGRLEQVKRFDVLVEAMRDLPGAILLLVGTGAAHEALRATARDLGVAHRVVLAGESDDVPAMLSAMDVFASPSPAETFGLALLEALAVGLPIVYVSGPVLEDVVATGAMPDIRRSSTDPREFSGHLAAVLAAAGPITSRDLRGYDIEAVAAEIHELYRQLSGPPGPVREPSRRGNP